MNLKNLTIKKAHNHLKAGDFSVKELAEACLKNVAEKNPEINAYLEIYADWPQQAAAAQELFKQGRAGLLTGIPLSVKDNILVKGQIASAGSRILENYRAVYDATAVGKLKKAGAVLLGRTNMDEFAMGSSTENSAFGPTKNPLDPSRVPGGSSGGSAAAVAMGGSLGALGSETGGSVRQPASFCGLLGLKPTYGRVSRYGLIALGSSLDQIGVMARTVGDVQILFEAVQGEDWRDATSLPPPADLPQPKKLTVGLPRNLLSPAGLDRSVSENFERSVGRLAEAGCQLKEISLPHASYSLAVYYIIMPAEASTNLARYDGVRFGHYRPGRDLLGDYLETRTAGFGTESRRRIILGAYVLSAGYYEAYYRQANLVRRAVIADFERAFSGPDGVDVIVTPTTPTPAFKLGEKTADPLSMYLSDLFTVPANIAGLPAISAPSGLSPEGLPLGLQIIAPPFREDLLFRTAGEFLKELD